MEESNDLLYLEQVLYKGNADRESATTTNHHGEAKSGIYTLA